MSWLIFVDGVTMVKEQGGHDHSYRRIRSVPKLGLGESLEPLRSLGAPTIKIDYYI